jgi:L-ascorbate metabolism protein UlaG (beta-lactamase superfamily)
MSATRTAKVLDLPTGAKAGAKRPDLKSGSIFFVGTATVLLRYAGFTILTDPNFLHRHEVAHLGYGLRSARRTEPAIDIADLQRLPVDLVILSHFHEDHFDRHVQRDLDKTWPIVTNRQAAATLRLKGFTNVHALENWETFTATKGGVALDITSMPGAHGPGILAKLLPRVMGSMLAFRTGAGGKGGTDTSLVRLYVTGDTLIHDKIHEIPRRYPDIDLALLHLGGTRAFGVLVTMDGAQGVEMIRIVNPRTAIPIHYNDYTVFKSPLTDFQDKVVAAGLADRVRYLSHGDTYTFEVPASRR